MVRDGCVPTFITFRDQNLLKNLDTRWFFYLCGAKKGDPLDRLTLFSLTGNGRQLSPNFRNTTA